MKFALVITLAVFLSLWIPFVSNSGSKHFYVSTHGNDTNNGSLDAPWRTIQKAATAATPGSTVHIRGGIYHERVEIQVSGSGSGGFIIFRSYSGEKAIIDGTNLPSTEKNALISIENRHYIILQNIELRNLKTSLPDDVPMGIFISGSSSSIEVRDSYIHHIETNYQSLNGSDAHGIAVYGNTSTPMRNIVVSGTEISDLRLGSSEALAINGNIDGFALHNNRIHNVDNIAMVAIGFEDVAPIDDRARNGVIRNNRVWAVDSSTNPAYGAICTPIECSGGDTSAGGIYVDGGTAITIEHNLVLDANIGIEIASEHAGKSSDYTVVRNNIISTIDYAGIAIGGYSSDGSGPGGGNARYNTIVNNTVYSPQQGAAFVAQYRVDNNTIRNNIFAADDGYQWEIVDPSTFIHNDTTPNLLTTVSVGQPNPNNLFKATMRPSNSELRLNLPSSTIQQFLHITALSPAYNVGATLDAGSTDIDGEPRLSQGALDLGADEVP